MVLMEKENDPLRVTIYGNPPGLNVETFFRRDFQVLALVVITPFFILGADSVPTFARLLSFLICWGAVGFFIRWNTKTRRPMAFEADRTGFRIKGGRRRHWNTFLGVSVERHVVNREDVFSCRVQLLGQSFDQAVRIGTYEYPSGADQAVQKILALKQRVDAIHAEEAENFALGAAPVVKARAKRQADNVRAVSIWERLGFLVGRY